MLIGVVSTNSRITVLWSQLIFLPSMLLGGLMLPFSMLPAIGAARVGAAAASHAMQAFIGLAYGQATVSIRWLGAGILLAGGLLAFGLAIYLFNWDRATRPAAATAAGAAGAGAGDRGAVIEVKARLSGQF